ncbi:MAG: hypothetical protein Q4E05_06995 [Pseudoclavibacter sp.]|nr:hypothetical protein [Pseudoclavibacter sp.]
MGESADPSATSPAPTDRERRQAEREARIRKVLARDGRSPEQIEDTLAGLRAAELGHPEPLAEVIRRAREQGRGQAQAPGAPKRPFRPRRPGPDRGIER